MQRTTKRNSQETLPVVLPPLRDPIWKLPREVVDEIVWYLSDCPRERQL